MVDRRYFDRYRPTIPWVFQMGDSSDYLFSTINFGNAVTMEPIEDEL